MSYGRASSVRFGSGVRRPRLDTAEPTRKHRPDYALLVIMGLLLVIGAVVVYAIGPGLTSSNNLPENFYSNKQLLAILLGIVGFTTAANIPIGSWKRLQPFIFAFAAIVAIAVRFVGDEVNGAHRWIYVGGLSFQAAELIKLALVLWLADFLSGRRLQQRISESSTLQVLGGVLGVTMIVVVGLQGDFGSAAVMAAMIGGTAYIAGLPMKKLGLVVAVIVLLGTIAVVSTPYRRQRVATFFSPTADCQDEGYQACQALITIGSGGLFGKGLGRSVQAYGYLPEPANDSIFAIVAEKFGFVGAGTVVVLFGLLFRRIARIARATETDYMRLLVSAVLIWLSVQMIINVGAMIGLLPLKGITLPFVSYGGTSIIFVMVAMGIVFQISRYTDLAALQSSSAHRTSSFSRRSTRGTV